MSREEGKFGEKKEKHEGKTGKSEGRKESRREDEVGRKRINVKRQAQKEIRVEV